MAAAEPVANECIQYVLQNGAWDGDLMLFAAGMGYEQSFRYAHRAGCQVTQRVIDAAARGGHFGCLQYAHENGFSLNI